MPALTAFVRRYPAIHINTQGGPSVSLFSEVLNGDLDQFIEGYLLAAAGGTIKRGGQIVDAD